MEAIIEFKKEKFVTLRENYNKIYKVGKIKDDLVYLEPEEVLYLLEKKKAIVKVNNKIIRDVPTFLSSFSEKINYKIYLAFKKIRDIGYYTDVYRDYLIVHMRGERNNPIYTVIPLYEYEHLPWSKILYYLDLAKQNQTKLLLALIDVEFDIVFYELSFSRI